MNTTKTSHERFQLGEIVITSAAHKALTESCRHPMLYLVHHVRGEWGDLDDAEKKINDAAVGHEGQPGRQFSVISAFGLWTGHTLMIRTSADRSCTTMFIEEEEV